MESYFFTISISNDIMNYDITKNFFEKSCKVGPYLAPSGKLFKRYIKDEDRFTIDNKAVVTIYESEKQTDVNFSLCFSNYSVNVEYIYNISKQISDLSKSDSYLILLDKKYQFNGMEIKHFKELLLLSHKEKYNIFITNYGNMNIDILPQNFYSYINKIWL